MAMADVLLVVHRAQPRALELGVEVESWWTKRGRSVAVVDAASPPEQLDGAGVGTRVAISLGGDGTMLRTVELAGASGIPVLGVNLGRMGYLTEVEPADLTSALDRLESGAYEVEERMTLDVSVSRRSRDEGEPRARRVGPTAPTGTSIRDGPGSLGQSGRDHAIALNEAIVEKAAPGRTLRVGIELAGRPFLRYVCDGLIVATPTGSTAYNLSARGPIVSPELRSMVLTPVAPHLLFDRSLVLGPEEEVCVTVEEGSSGMLVVDGAHMEVLSAGDSVACRAGKLPARLVRFGRRDFHAILRSKFGLGEP
jgi:NAD+ kinase